MPLSSLPEMNIMYIGGGAAAGYFVAPGMLGVTPIMGAAVGAAAGFALDYFMNTAA